MNTCSQCEELKIAYKFNSPSQFSHLIVAVRTNLNEGVIKEDTDYWPPGQIKFDQKPFSEVKKRGPWDDILQYYFRCVTCEQLFSLYADTYHGRGEWKTVS